MMFKAVLFCLLELIWRGGGREIGVVTWNLNQQPPPRSSSSWLRSLSDCDLIVVGMQELRDDSKAGKTAWLSSALKKTDGKFRPVAHHTLGGLQLVVLAKAGSSVKLCSIRDVACGIGNVMLNKGAICLVLKIGSCTLALVTAHLAAHHGAISARNTQYNRIRDELFATFGTEFSDVDAIIFCGDLNYRLNNLRRSEVELALCESAQNELFYFDQLFRERAAARAFPIFSEASISFLPTYKFDRHSDTYDSSSKRRTPAWTDRILFTPNPILKLIEYSSVPSAKHSDHRPVFARFQLLPFSTDGDLKGKKMPSSSLSSTTKRKRPNSRINPSKSSQEKQQKQRRHHSSSKSKYSSFDSELL